MNRTMLPSLAIVALVILATGFTLRIAYEYTNAPIQAQERDPTVGIDCADFESQAEAQEELRSNPDDPNVLDNDRDGIACETFDYDNPETDETPVNVPNGGTTTPSPSPPPTTNPAPSPPPKPNPALLHSPLYDRNLCLQTMIVTRYYMLAELLTDLYL
jgi:hypothetical protein